nr:MAG TPA: hypothetical protein [Caudoviricetes sp.]
MISACFFSASVNSLAVFPIDFAYSSFASVALTMIPRLSRISADPRPRPVTISLKA